MVPGGTSETLHTFSMLNSPHFIGEIDYSSTKTNSTILSCLILLIKVTSLRKSNYNREKVVNGI